MIGMPWKLKRYWQTRLMRLVEQWVGEPLENTDIYGTANNVNADLTQLHPNLIQTLLQTSQLHPNFTPDLSQLNRNFLPNLLQLNPELSPGMRRYEHGARLLTHVDREETHATSMIINIAQGE
jgi:alkylated DNA repair dioxygenase AlkB